MEPMNSDDFDSFFLFVKNGIEPQKRGDELPYKDFGMNFWIRIPNKFEEAKSSDAADIFWSENRPTVIFLTKKKNEGITFQTLKKEELGIDISIYCKKIRDAIDQMDDRTVFYEQGVTGETDRIHWLEYKAFAANERIYRFVFWFQAKDKIVMGTFFCLFKNYNIWKPIVFEMLSTIRMEEFTDEGIQYT